MYISKNQALYCPVMEMLPSPFNTAEGDFLRFVSVPQHAKSSYVLLLKFHLSCCFFTQTSLKREKTGHC